MTIDPVCKMNVEHEKATAKVEHAGKEYYFCRYLSQGFCRPRGIVE
jgi:YHS domain-containing protein